MNKKHLILVLLLIFAIYTYRNVLVYRPLLNIVSLAITNGNIINDKDVSRGNLIRPFSYYYEFSVNGKKYSNPSYDEKYKIGDTVVVEYNKEFPFMNRLKN
ncbi:hypothetical protein SAMN05421594_2252 [Chryseobacterium oleae]|uniref:DUF3592 domain-containing protein n=1 Tax=Chryseobacterium oleae TaxID=491207 RepID=A0A1I4Y9Y2_CHROL|nr:hypothetical protein [Chryseobacterium oleae]SFN34866.1 hypothetical protein SAMN05421594_2252 [Chryseobacterium oleae]